MTNTIKKLVTPVKTGIQALHIQNFYYGNDDVLNNIDEAIPKYGGREFQSPTRSTVPLLSWLKHEPSMVESLLQDLGMSANFDLHLEYKVKPLKGHGKASHTDMMVVSEKSSLAIEAKWTEPRYESISKWRSQGADSQNRCDVLAGWLDFLQQHAPYPLHSDAFSVAVYQMVHRAASACSTGCNPKLAYLMFRSSQDPKSADMQKIHEDLTKLWDLLGKPDTFPFYLVELPLFPTAAFKEIAPLQKANKTTAEKKATAEKVRTALKSNRLFDFDKYCIKKIGDKS